MRLDTYEPLTIPFVLHLHRLLFNHADGNGGHLKTDQNLIVSYESGRREVVFTPPPPEETEFLLGELLVRYEDAKREGRTHPLVLIGALILDFLAIHPVADGNGRLARLLTTYEMLSRGTAWRATSASSSASSNRRTATTRASTSLSETGTRANTTSGRGSPISPAFSPPLTKTSSSG